MDVAFFNYYINLSMCVMCVEVRGQLASVFSPCGFQGLNLGCQLWPKLPLLQFHLPSPEVQFFLGQIIWYDCLNGKFKLISGLVHICDINGKR